MIENLENKLDENYDKKSALKKIYNERIDSEKGYDRNYFVDKFDKFSDLERYYSEFKKDSHNQDVIGRLGSLLHPSNPGFYGKFSNPASIIQIEGDNSYEIWGDAMGKYVKNNIDDFYNLLDDSDWVSLISNIPLYKTYNREHDEFVEASWGMNELREASQDASKMNQYVEDKMKEAPEWLQMAINSLQGNREYMSAIFEEFAGVAQNEFQKQIYTIENNKPKVNKNRLKSIVEDSLAEAWKEHDEETSEWDKKNIWERNLRPCYTMIGKVAFPKEKKEMKLEVDEEKQERRDQRREIGMM